MYKFAIIIYLFIANILQLKAQYTLTGKVIDTNKNPIVFADIFIKKSVDSTLVISGTVSDFNGDFILEVPNIKFNPVLVVSSMGFKQHTEKIYLSDLKPITISLIEDVNTLEEVHIIASNSITKNKIDRKEFSITNIDKKSAISSLSLLNKIPTLKIDETSNTIQTKRGKNVKVLINGVNSNATELMTIEMDNIKSIEYFDIIPIKYQNSGYSEVVNIITKDKIRGGHIFSSLQNAITTGYGNYIVDLSYNKKQSCFNFDYYYSFRDYKKKRIDENLIYNTLNSSHNKNIIGINSAYGYDMHRFSLAYSNKKKKSHLLNIKITPTLISVFDKPKYNLSRQDDDILISGNGTQIYNRDEVNYSLDIYFQKKKSNNSEIVLNVLV